MKNNLKSQVLALAEQGLEPPEVLRKLHAAGHQVSQASVYRWLKELGEDGLDSLVPDEKEESSLASALPPNESRLKEKELELKERELAGIETEKEATMAGKKRRALKTYNNLVNGFFDRSQGYKWSRKNVKKMLKEIEKLQDSIEEIFDGTLSDFRENALWANLENFKERFEGLLSGGQGIDFDFNLTDDQVHDLETDLILFDFDAGFNWEEYHTKRHRGQVLELIQDFIKLHKESLDREDVRQLRSEVKDYRERIEAEGLGDSMGEEITTLKEIFLELKEMERVIRKSFWGSVEFDIKPKKWKGKLNELNYE